MRTAGSIVVAFFICIAASAQHLQIRFTDFFAESQLSSRCVTCIMQDSRSSIWIGTQDGLNCFNGKTVQRYKHDRTDAATICDNQVTSIAEDSEGRIWIGTNNGVSALDPFTGKSRSFRSDANGEPLGFTCKVHADNSGNIWAFIGQLFLFKKADSAFHRMRCDLPEGAIISGFYQDLQNAYWLSTSRGLFALDTASGHTRRTGPDEFFFQPLGGGNRFFAGSWGKGLFVFHGNEVDTITGQNLHAAYAIQRIGGRDMLWSSAGQSLYDASTWMKLSWQPNAGTKPRNDIITAYFTDRQGQLWIGYNTSGVQLVNPANQLITAHFPFSGNINIPHVSCMQETAQGIFVGGWYGTPLALLDKRLRLVRGFPKLCKRVTNVADMVQLRGALWLATTDGLVRMDPLTFSTRQFRFPRGSGIRPSFLQIAAEGDSVLWLAGYFSGLSRFSLNTHQFANWRGSEKDLYWGIAAEGDHLWLADNQTKVRRFDKRTGTFTVFAADSLIEHAICGAIAVDTVRHFVWVATDNGLLRIHSQTGSMKLYTESDKLPTSHVSRVQVDRRGRVWIGTANGLSCFDPSTGVFRNYGTDNGLPSALLDELFSIRADGKLYMGVGNGIAVMDIDRVLSRGKRQLVFIQSIRVSGQPFGLSNAAEVPVLDLPHDQDNLRIAFASADLVSSTENRLMYRLEGHDSGWQISGDGIVNYSRLAPGAYLFHASATDHLGLNASSDAFAVIIVHPPFWQTGWFIGSLTCLVLLIAVLWARYIFTRNLRERILILEKEQALDKERNRISQDMHDELGSGLTKISVMSEVALTQAEGGGVRTQLGHISAASRELVDRLQDIVWILKSGNSTLDVFCAYLREYAFRYLEPAGIAVTCATPDDIPPLRLAEDVKRDLLLVMKEAFGNICRHSQATAAAVSIRITSEQLVIEIKDNGKGFDPANTRPFSNGLSNMRKRAAALGGELTLHSIPLHGTAVALHLPLTLLCDRPAGA